VRTVVVTAVVPDASADDVFAKVCDFSSYPRHSDVVQEVEVSALPDGTVESDWAVRFRNGVLCWSERDVLQPETGRISFEQLDGDFETFRGGWSVDQDGSSVTVRFEAAFDLGMPSLAPMIDPIAEHELTETMQAILRGLLGDRVEFTSEGAA
jgi:ribosome-associated toxin RatA of RatAB toxin-antitoxin module